MSTERAFTWIHRLIHWGIALPMLLILLTIGLRNGWLEKHHMAQLIRDGVADTHQQISDTEAIKIAKSIRNVMFAWHFYAGYVIGVMLLLRWFYFHVAGSFHGHPQASKRHQAFQGWVYFGFYILLALNVISGLLFMYGGSWVPDIVRQLHKLGLWYIIPFLILHLAGMILAETGPQAGLVSKMFGRR